MLLNEKNKRKLIYKVFKEMDEKTGLNANSLPICFSNSTNRKGCFYSTKTYRVNNNKKILINSTPIKFKFSNYLFDGRYSRDVIEQVIKHEYIHYYCCVKYPKINVKHGKEFKDACRKYDINDETTFNYNLNEDIDDLNLEKKLVYVVKCTNCKSEFIRQKKSKIINNLSDYRCAKCGGIFEYNKEYRLLN